MRFLLIILSVSLVGAVEVFVVHDNVYVDYKFYTDARTVPSSNLVVLCASSIPYPPVDYVSHWTIPASRTVMLVQSEADQSSQFSSSGDRGYVWMYTVSNSPTVALVHTGNEVHAHEGHVEVLCLGRGSRASMTSRRSPRRQASSARTTANSVAIARVVESVTGVALMAVVGLLVDSWPSRSTSSSFVTSIVDFLKQQFISAGYSDAFQQDFDANGTPSHNIVAVKTGWKYPKEVLVIGAHFDTVSELTASSPDGTAPGAEDNASGVAAVLELARVCAAIETERSIYFVAFGGEEQGLFGSTHLVHTLQSDGVTVVGAITADMIGYSGSNPGLIVESESEFASFVDTVVGGFGLTPTAMQLSTSFFAFGSDHVPFLQAGIPAVLVIDSAWQSYPAYHRSTDLPGLLNGTQLQGAAQGMLASALSIAVGSFDPFSYAGRSGGDEPRCWTKFLNPRLVLAASPLPARLDVCAPYNTLSCCTHSHAEAAIKAFDAWLFSQPSQPPNCVAMSQSLVCATVCSPEQSLALSPEFTVGFSFLLYLNAGFCESWYSECHDATFMSPANQTHNDSSANVSDGEISAWCSSQYSLIHLISLSLVSSVAGVPRVSVVVLPNTAATPNITHNVPVSPLLPLPTEYRIPATPTPTTPAPTPSPAARPTSPTPTPPYLPSPPPSSPPSPAPTQAIPQRVVPGTSSPDLSAATGVEFGFTSIVVFSLALCLPSFVL